MNAKFRGVLAPGRRAAYALAGDAVITIMNPATGMRFTYRIKQSACRCTQVYGFPKKDCPSCRGTGAGTHYFIKVLTGPENSSDYFYLGTIFPDGQFRVTARSRISGDAPSAVAFLWLVGHWENEKIEVWHEGVCGRCGRRLTVPESIESGIGPVCATRGAA